jgi:hypothetical protein
MDFCSVHVTIACFALDFEKFRAWLLERERLIHKPASQYFSIVQEKEKKTEKTEPEKMCNWKIEWEASER